MLSPFANKAALLLAVVSLTMAVPAAACPKKKADVAERPDARVQGIALAGFFDVNDDGKSDLELIRRLIEMNGGVIDAEINLDGKGVGHLRADTKMLIVGKLPDKTTASPDVVRQFDEFMRRATELNVRIFHLKELLGWNIRRPWLERNDDSEFRPRRLPRAGHNAALPDTNVEEQPDRLKCKSLSVMSNNFCPECGEQIPAESINIAEGVALCRSSGQLSRLSDVASRKRPIAEILSQPPRGCSVTECDQNIVVYATLRSFTGFFGMLFVSLFWNGIVSVFLLLALAGLQANLIGPLPPWFPAPDNGDQMSLDMTLFLCVFLTPFVAVGSMFIGAVILSAAGKVEVSIEDHDAVVRTGVWFLTWRRRVDPALVRRVGIESASWLSNGQPSQDVVIDADGKIKLGSMLRDDRREWIQAVLHELLAEPNPDKRRDRIATLTQPGRWA